MGADGSWREHPRIADGAWASVPRGLGEGKGARTEVISGASGDDNIRVFLEYIYNIYTPLSRTLEIDMSSLF